MRFVYTHDPDMKLVETSGYPYFFNSCHINVSKHSQVERVGGIEPPSPAWKAGVIAFIRYPHRFKVADGSVLPVSRQRLPFIQESK